MRLQFNLISSRTRKTSSRERKEAFDVEMLFDVLGERIERAFHLAAIAFG